MSNLGCGLQPRGWCELCCGRGCGCCAAPFRRYQEAFSAGRWMPTLKVTNFMNQEAILQARFCLASYLWLAPAAGGWPGTTASPDKVQGYLNCHREWGMAAPRAWAP